jgi:signal transduction histidine kinase
VGSLLTEDPLVAELMKSSVGSGFGTFTDLKGEPVQGLYEQVDSTNVYAVITTPINALMADRGTTRLNLALMGLGLGLIGLALFVFTDKGPRRLATLPQAAPAQTTMTSEQVPAGGEKMKAYVQVASSLSHELKSPLTAILGYVQMAKGKMTDPKGIEQLEKIEGEARASRSIIQKLLIFAGEDKVTSQKMGLETAVNKALKHVEGKLISKGIKLHKSIQTVPPFTMAGDLVTKAIENILLNAIEAMERAPKKELTVTLKSEGSQMDLTIQDSGEGIASEDLTKIFDPFFTTRSGTQHVGLGLSTALGIFKEAFGEIHVTSEKGKGTSVKVSFNPQEGLLSAADLPSRVQQKSVMKAPVEAPPAPMPAAEQKAETPPAPSPVAGGMPLNPLLVDTTIDRLIEDDSIDMPEPPAEMKAEEALPPPPVKESEAPSFSAKIDKPKIEIKKKSSPLDEMSVSVRRPGDRV